MQRPRSLLAASLVAVALLATACGSSNDPTTWEEAEAQDGFPVRENFLDACLDANTGQQGMSAEEADSYCDCAFVDVREALSFDEFEQLDDDLREDSTDLRPDVRDLFEACAAEVG